MIENDDTNCRAVIVGDVGCKSKVVDSHMMRKRECNHSLTHGAEQTCSRRASKETWDEIGRSSSRRHLVVVKRMERPTGEGSEGGNASFQLLEHRLFCRV
jgi:RNA-splicing ligase RtcB